MAAWPQSSALPSQADAMSTLTAQGQRHDRNHHEALALGQPEDEDGDAPISLGQKMLSATLGSLVTSLLVTPLDVVRVRLQSQHIHTPTPYTRPSSGALATPYSFSNPPPNLGISTCCREVFWMSNNTQVCVATPSTVTAISDSGVKAAAACAAEEVQRRTYSSTLDGLRKIAANEGPTTLWRGLSPTLAMAIPANVLYFASYDWLRFHSKSPFRRMNMSETYIPLAAGSFARIIAAYAVGPIEMFRTRMQAAHNTPGKNGNFVETLQDMKTMTSQRGYRSLWTGLTLTLWRDVPFSALYWWGYEYGRDKLRENRQKKASLEAAVTETNHPEGGRRRRRSSAGQEDHTATLIDSFVAGAASGAFAAFVTTPFDVGKTRQQTLQHTTQASSITSTATATAKTSAMRPPEELPMPRFLWHIFQTQGAAGLFRGWAARCLKVAPACAIMISFYELGKKVSGGMNDRRYQI